MTKEVIQHKGYVFGYARVSTDEQELHRQVDALSKEGYDRLFTEKVTGAKRDRPELNRLLDTLREGDTVLILEISRLSRSTKDLLELVSIIKEKGAALKSINDTWLDTTKENPYSDFLLTVMAGLSQLERDVIRLRTKEGMESAKKRGVNVGRPTVDAKKVNHALKLYDSGEYSIKDIVELSGISQGKLYKEINKRNLK